MPFMEDEDQEAMNEELKEAFRLYDKEGRQEREKAFVIEVTTSLITHSVTS